MSRLDEVAMVEPLLAGHAVPEPGPGRFEDTPRDATRAAALEAVYEGYLLHYRRPRAFAGMDADLELLGGDTLYAHGLATLADRGDLEAVAELADLITLCARAEVEGRGERSEGLWRASARALAEGGPGAWAAAGADGTGSA